MSEINHSQLDEKAKDIELINAAKRRLLALESVEKKASELVQEVKADSYFVSRESMLLMAAEVIVVFITIVILHSLLTSHEPISGMQIFDLLLSLGIAVFLFLRLKGLRRIKRNEKQLKKLKQYIADEQKAADSICLKIDF